MANKKLTKEQETRKVFEAINTVDGFEPKFLAQEYTDEKGNTSLNIAVKDRVSWFRLMNPEGCIITKLVSDDGKKAVMKAFIYGTGKILLSSATGSAFYGEDCFGRSYVECAETKAIGRALGFAGFGTQFCNDFELPEDTPVDTGVQVSANIKSKPKSAEKKPVELKSAFDEVCPESLEDKVEKIAKTINPSLSKKMIIPYGPCATLTISDVYKAEKNEDKLATIKQYAYPDELIEKYLDITAACRVFIDACLANSK